MTDELAGARSESVKRSGAMDPIAMLEESNPSNEAIRQGSNQPRSWRQKGKAVCKFYQIAGGKCKLSIRDVSFRLGSFVLLWHYLLHIGLLRLSYFFYFTRVIVFVLY